MPEEKNDFSERSQKADTEFKAILTKYEVALLSQTTSMGNQSLTSLVWADARKKEESKEENVKGKNNETNSEAKPTK